MTDATDVVRRAVDQLDFSIQELQKQYQDWEEIKETVFSRYEDFDRYVDQLKMLLRDHTSETKSWLVLKEEWSDVRELLELAKIFVRYLQTPDRMSMLGRNIAIQTEKLLKNKHLLPTEDKKGDIITEVDVITRLTPDQQRILYGWLEENEHSGSASTQSVR